MGHRREWDENGTALRESIHEENHGSSALSLSLFAVIVVAATAVDATATVPKCSTEQRRKDGYSKGKREE